jgi:hypothetical protein
VHTHVINDHSNVDTADYQRATVIVHGWGGQPDQVPARSDQAQEPPSTRSHEPLDYVEVVVAAIAAGAMAADGSTVTSLLCGAAGLAHLMARCDWRGTARRIRQAWRTYRTPGRHRAQGRASRFCPS